MQEILNGYVRASVESAEANGELRRLAAEVAVFDAALVGSEPLRRVLGDAGVASTERRAVVADLLEANASSETASLLDFAVLVERPGELAAAVATLVALIEEALAGVDRFSVEQTTGRLAVRERIRGYAERVFTEIVERSEIDSIEDELFRFARILEAHHELRDALTDVRTPISGRIGVVNDLLAGKTNPATTRLVSYVLRAGRLRDLVGTFDWLVEVAAEERGRRVAEVRSATELDDRERDRLAKALGQLVRRNVEVRVVIDESVIAGVLVSVGDLVIDGTVRLRFEKLRDLLVQAS